MAFDWIIWNLMHVFEIIKWMPLSKGHNCTKFIVKKQRAITLKLGKAELQFFCTALQWDLFTYLQNLNNWRDFVWIFVNQENFFKAWCNINLQKKKVIEIYTPLLYLVTFQDSLLWYGLWAALYELKNSLLDLDFYMTLGLVYWE